MDYGRLSSILWHQVGREENPSAAKPKSQSSVERQYLGLSDWEILVSSLNRSLTDKSLENELAATLFSFRELVKKYRKRDSVFES